MKILCLGTGAACDPGRGNTSLLLDNRLLLDCGFTAAHAYFRRHPAADDLEGVWISHFHGDHCFALPLLLLGLWERRRTRPLVVAGPPGLNVQVRQLLELSYPGFAARFAFSLETVEITPHTPFELAGYRCGAALTEHSRTNLAIRVDDGRFAVYYSGDGRPTAAGNALARGCDLILHEAFASGEPPPGHGSVQGSMAFAATAGAGRLALLHVAPEARAALPAAVDAGRKSFAGLQVEIPADGDLFVLE
ncbi:MAG: MBL fold metallo-hydrolase [Thermodesulfobacteriota bacterium]